VICIDRVRSLIMKYTCRNIYISLLMNEKVYSVDLPTLRNVIDFTFLRIKNLVPRISITIYILLCILLSVVQISRFHRSTNPIKCKVYNISKDQESWEMQPQEVQC